MPQDYYDILGVKKGADAKQLKTAYRQLAKKYHPDANPNDPTAETRFKEVSEAYQVLSDPEKRRAYDQFGHNYRNFTGGGGGGNPYANAEGGTAFDFEDIFGSMFGNAAGGGGRRSNSSVRFEYGPFGDSAAGTKGRDIEHGVTITLREAYEGTTRYITKEGRRIKVNIPAGAASGTKVRLTGEGEPGPLGGDAGDLYLVVDVGNDDTFERDGDDLHVDVKVDALTAMLGGSVRVTTMERPVKVKIAPGTQSGLKLRLTGKGMPKLKAKDTHGNLYAHVQITVPENLTDEQRALVEQLRESLGQ